MPINVSLDPIPQREESTLKYLVNNFNRIRDALAKAIDGSTSWAKSLSSSGRSAWVPAVSQTATLTYNAGTSYFAYTVIQGTVIGNFRINITSAGTLNGLVSISVPVTAKDPNNLVIGNGWYFDTSAGAFYRGPLQVSTGGLMQQRTGVGVMGTAGFADSFPAAQAAANGDIWSGQFSYEAA